MKKILFFINTLGIGGAEHVLIDIVNSLNKDKFDITIKTIYDTNVYNNINSNIKVDSFYHSKKNKFLDKVCRKFLYWKIKLYSKEKLYRMMVKDSYDIEVSFLEGLPTKIIAGSNSSAKKVAWIHCNFKINTDSDYFFKSLDEQKEVYKSYDELYFVSNESKRSFENRFFSSDNLYVMYNILNYDLIKEKSKEFAELSSDFNIISVGRLTAQKSYERLFLAYKNALNNLNVNTHLYIVGDGEEREKLERVIIDLNMNSNITLLGKSDNPYKYMKCADLYVCSSLSEGYPLVVQEALSLELPVLSTNCLGKEDLFHNEDFGLIVNNSVEGITNGLVKIINDDVLLKKYKKNIHDKYNFVKNKIDPIESQLLK